MVDLSFLLGLAKKRLVRPSAQCRESLCGGKAANLLQPVDDRVDSLFDPKPFDQTVVVEGDGSSSVITAFEDVGGGRVDDGHGLLIPLDRPRLDELSSVDEQRLWNRFPRHALWHSNINVRT